MSSLASGAQHKFAGSVSELCMTSTLCVMWVRVIWWPMLCHGIQIHLVILTSVGGMTAMKSEKQCLNQLHIPDEFLISMWKSPVKYFQMR